jgi:hypothetical protein
MRMMLVVEVGVKLVMISAVVIVDENMYILSMILFQMIE